MLGILEQVEEKRSQRGETYWALILSGRRYTVWSPELVQGLQRGDQVEFTYTQSGQYRKLLELRKASPQNLNRWFQHHNERGQRIARMSCLKTAAQIIEGKRLNSTKKAELVLHVARIFEKHVLGEPTSGPKDTKVKA